MSENPLLPAAYDVIWSGIVLLLVVLLIWAMVSIARSGLDPQVRLVWAIIVLLLPVVGPICWFVARPQNSDSSLS
ncbi:PLDc_N domain-containing protein [Brevibacterium permense]|uniref:PLD nuclease N-terminal domain-containing protein n=1 Tax=Brevibacterium permense TaxID=234834 RepID=UPI0021CEF759|nr:PLD nuclease N-terminal domain-containing protein [Brevibacterium permense]MCU4296707.1 PLDc_N domain-containing protein [Brevibacterium permense]